MSGNDKDKRRGSGFASKIPNPFAKKDAPRKDSLEEAEEKLAAVTKQQQDFKAKQDKIAKDKENAEKAAAARAEALRRAAETKQGKFTAKQGDIAKRTQGAEQEIEQTKALIEKTKYDRNVQAERNKVEALKEEIENLTRDIPMMKERLKKLYESLLPTAEANLEKAKAAKPGQQSKAATPPASPKQQGRESFHAGYGESRTSRGNSVNSTGSQHSSGNRGPVPSLRAEDEGFRGSVPPPVPPRPQTEKRVPPPRPGKKKPDNSDDYV